MATNLTSTTFLSEYNDDYRDSDHYHRILFNNGRALQARELTQMQTIIQEEVARLARFVLNEGAIFNNNTSLATGAEFAFTSIKLDSLPTGYAQLKGATVSDGDLSATVKAVIPATGSDPATILVKMTSGQSGGSAAGSDTTTTKKFAAGATLTTSGPNLGPLTIQSVSDAVGRGSMVEVPEYNTFAGGHLIQVDAQSLVIDKYSATPTVNVGFKVKQEIHTTADNIALYDNSGSTPNLTSPGADRLKITLELIKESDKAAGDTYFETYVIVNGEAKLTRTQDKILSRLGDIIHDRLKAVSGDFIEKRVDGMFNLTVTPDSADDDYLSARISSGTAFVGGVRIQSDYNLPIRIQKPRSETYDLTTKTNEFLAANYGTYFLCDSAYGLVSKISDLEEINLYSAADRGGSNIGTARIRHIDEYNNQYRIHVFDLNTTASLATVRSIGVDATNYANLTDVQGRYDLLDRGNNTLLFKLPRARVWEISDVSMAVGKIYQDVTSASGVAQISTGTSNQFTDTEQWIVSDSDNSGTLFTEVSVSLTNGNATANISGLNNLANVSVLAYENVTAALKTKTLKPSTTTWESSTVSLSNGVFTLPHVDIYEFNKVTDDTTNEDITRKFDFDNGQRDNYYGPGKGTLKSGQGAPSGTVTVEYRYFQHSSPGGVGYFGGKASYDDLAYENIPKYQSRTGATYRLADVIDMRPVKNPSDETFSGGISRIEPIPRNTDTITIGTAKYWNPRIDLISINKQGELIHYEGNSSSDPVLPNSTNNDTMPLHVIALNPYTFNEKDIATSPFNNVGYKMSDIRALESRVSRLERVSTLTISEMNLAQLEVYDPATGTNIRQTQGLSGDGFNNKLQSILHDDDYRAKVAGGSMTPYYYVRSLNFTYDSDLSTNTVLKGSNVWPKYTEEVYISQDDATGYDNVNQFEIAQSIGTVSLTPKADTWTIRRKVDESYAQGANSSLTPERLINMSSQS
jgi:hypothetical protein